MQIGTTIQTGPVLIGLTTSAPGPKMKVLLRDNRPDIGAASDAAPVHRAVAGALAASSAAQAHRAVACAIAASGAAPARPPLVFLRDNRPDIGAASDAAPVHRAVVVRGPDPAPVHQAVRRPDPVMVSKTDATVFFLELMHHFENADPEQLKGKTIRVISRDQKDETGKDLGGLIVLSDAGAAILFTNQAGARQWTHNINQVNVSRAPSLTYIVSRNHNVCLLIVDL